MTVGLKSIHILFGIHVFKSLAPQHPQIAVSWRAGPQLYSSCFSGLLALCLVPCLPSVCLLIRCTNECIYFSLNRGYVQSLVAGAFTFLNPDIEK